MITTTKISAMTMAVLISIATFFAAPATAATSSYYYAGYAAGSQVRLLGGAIRSDLTSASSLDGVEVPTSQNNTLASVKVGALLSAGAIETSASAVAAGNGAQTDYRATTAKVSLLDGLIKADAVETVNRSTVNSTTKTGGVDTTFVRLTVAGAVIPLSVDRNFKVSIPGVATVVLNKSTTTPKGNGLVTEGSAIYVTLLAARDGAPAGSTIVVNPTRSEIAPVGPIRPLGGYAYVTSANASVGKDVQVVSGPTASIGVPTAGTGGTTLYNSTLAVDLPGVLSVGAVESTATGTTRPGLLDSATTAQAARVNLLNGLITADAVKASSRNKKVNVGAETFERTTSLVKLRLLGLPIAVNPPANTTINLPGVAKIVLNEQTLIGGRKVVTAIHVTLLAPAGGLGVGADIRVAVASTWLGK